MFWRKKKAPKSAPLQPEKPVYRSLSEGAARFAAIARSAHGQPLDGATVCTSPDHCSSAISPDEIWARQFMTQGIGPLTEGNGFSKMPPMQSSFAMQSFTLKKTGEVHAASTAQHPPVKAESSGPIGAQIGRSKERSRLGRLFRG